MNLVESALQTGSSPSFSMLEIGPGSWPFRPNSYIFEPYTAATNTNFDFSGERRYIGVDNGSAVGNHSYLGSPEHVQAEARRRLKSYEERIKGSRPGQNIDFIFGDILEMDLPPDSFNTVIMNEVLSSMIGVEGAKLLIDCSARLLAEEGLLVARESFTPELIPHGDIVLQMIASGFSQAEAVPYSTRREEYNALRDHFGESFHDFNEPVRSWCDRYFTLAMK